MAPELDTAAFPDDVETLRALLAQRDALIAERDAALAERDAELRNAGFEIEKLKVQLATLRRDRYGRSSEKLAAEADQLEMLIGDLEETRRSARPRRRRRSAGPRASPATSASLPRAGHCPSTCRARRWCTSPSSPAAAAAPIPPA